MAANRNAVILMLKYPEPGKVKTRLAAHLGDLKAAEIARKMAEQVVAQVSSGRADYSLHICCDPPDRLEATRTWLVAGNYFSQVAGSLGERMQAAFEYVFAAGAARAFVIGTDCIDVTSGHLMEGFQLLDSADLVLGPAVDGGYWALGLKVQAKHNLNDLMSGIRWGTPSVFLETLARARALNLGIRLLPLLSDIDEIDDLPERAYN